MNNKIVLKKTTSAIFLAFVLVVGTFALSIPSFMIGAAQASSDREKDHDNGDKKSYGKDRDRDDKSRDHDKYDNDDKKSYGKDRDRDDKSRDHTDDKTNKYESTKYSDYIDNRYNSYEPGYGMDNDYKERYGKDSYESQYSSYGKDNNNYYKSKDSSSNSVNIKKVKCNNINVNLNGIDVNIGAPNGNGPITEAQAAEDERLESNSFGSDSRSGNNYVRDGHSDYDTDFRFVCINNNNNTVVAVNETTPELPEPLTCEECFTENLTVEQVNNISDVLSPSDFRNLEGLCEFLSNSTFPNNERLSLLGLLFAVAEIPDEDAFRVLECLEELGLVTLPPEF